MTKRPNFKSLVLINTRHKYHWHLGGIDEVRLPNKVYHRPTATWTKDAWTNDGGYWETKTSCGRVWAIAIDIELAKQAQLEPCATCYPKKKGE